MRTIVHLDADAFFASVEQAADARLRGRPIAVGGESRGIIASASYEARKFGVYTPMPTARARKLCPKLIVLPGDYERYEQFSHWMFSYAYDFTPAVEQTSIDEGYFDITANRTRPSIAIAQTIRQAIRQSLKITVSEGIASNKLVSQIASKLNKPAAFQTVPAGREKSFLHPLPNRWLPGVGPKTAVRLNAAGLADIGHVAATPVDLLALLLGSQAPVLRQFANGIDERPLIPASEPQKSFSQQETFAEDVTDEDYVEAVLRRMADRLFAAVREEGRSVRTLTVKVRYNDRDENQRAESLREPTDLETDVYGRLRGLLREAWQRRVSLRMVSLKLSNVYDGVFRDELPLEIEAQNHAARERLAAVLDGLRRDKGWSVVLRGHDLRLRDAPQDPVATAARKPGQKDSNGVAARPHPSPLPQEREKLFQRGIEVTALRTFQTQRNAVPSPGGEGQGEGGRSLSTELSRPNRPVSPKGKLELSHSPTSKRHECRAPARARQSAAVYVPLRVRSHYTFLDSTLSPAAIVDLARQHGLPAVALTDLGNLHGAVEFAQAAKRAGIKPIFGTELRVGEQPLLLYVESARGYANLNRLLSLHAEAAGEPGAVAAQQRRPISFEHLDGLTGGLIAVSADPRLAELFPGRFYRMATKSLAANLAFGVPRSRGPDRLKAELQTCCHAGHFGDSRHDSSFREAFASDTGKNFSVVACPAIHYALPGDRLKYDIVQSIRTLTLLRQEHPSKRRGGRFHFRAPAEMVQACREHPDWLAHSLEIAGRCNFELPFGKPQFPAFTPPDGSTPREFLRRLVFTGARRRYPAAQLSAVNPQLEQELGIIGAVGYEEYFLVVWNLLQDCRRRGIEWITRGSAADSLVCYCLGISDVCPIRFGLYFRRFLNPERMALNKLPDIDIDFPHDRKDDVVELIFARYGRGQCAVVGGFSTFQARSAFADVAKVLGVAEREVRRFTEHFPWGFGGGWVPDEPAPGGGARLRELLAASPENRDLPLNDEPFRTAIDMAEFLDGVPRHPKMHPCGVVLSRQPMHELTPTFVSNKGYPTTHFDMDAVEAIGLVKVDVLAQGGLAVMRDVKASLAQRGVEVDLSRCAVVSSREPAAQSFSSSSSPARPQRSEGWSSKTKRESKTSNIEHRTPNIEQQKRDHAVSFGVQSSMFDVERALLTSCPTNRKTFAGDDVRSRPRRRARSARPASLGFREQEALHEPEWKETSAAFPYDDPEVWDMISGGGARAVHHIESPAMTGLCRQSNVRDIDTLIAIVSVIRPGAANEGKKLAFTRRYQGLEPVTYPHPSLEPVLRDTFGLVVYEEHILQICEAFAGLPPGRADVLRRALNKQKRAVVAEIREEFFASASARGHAPGKIEEVWGLVAGFAGYAFCKAHSTAYGIEAYQSAWLKRNFPADFMAGVLTNGKGFYDPLVYVLESYRLGLTFLPPTVNEPGPGFTVVADPGAAAAQPDACFDHGWTRMNTDKKPTRIARRITNQKAAVHPRQFAQFASDESFIRVHPCPSVVEKESSHRADPGGLVRSSGFSRSRPPEGGTPNAIRVPLTRAKGLSERTIKRLLAERERGPFASLIDFHRRVQPLPEELETMIRAGGFDEFGWTRTRQFWEAQRARRAEVGSRRAEVGSRRAEVGGRRAEVGGETLEFDFDGGADPVSAFSRQSAGFLREPTRRERLEAEAELFGYPVSGHPLELFANVAWNTYCPVARLGEHPGETVVTCGLVVEQRTHHQITGEPMKFLTLADWTGMVETELFAQTYKSYGLATVRYPVLEITATVEPFDNGRGFSLRVLRAGKPRSLNPRE